MSVIAVIGRTRFRRSRRFRRSAIDSCYPSVGLAGGSLVEAKLNWVDGERFVASASSGHAIVIDSDRQRNPASGPMEFVMIRLCACTAPDALGLLPTNRQPFSGLKVPAEPL